MKNSGWPGSVTAVSMYVVMMVLLLARVFGDATPTESSRGSASAGAAAPTVTIETTSAEEETCTEIRFAREIDGADFKFQIVCHCRTPQDTRFDHEGIKLELDFERVSCDNSMVQGYHALVGYDLRFKPGVCFVIESRLNDEKTAYVPTGLNHYVEGTSDAMQASYNEKLTDINNDRFYYNAPDFKVQNVGYSDLCTSDPVDPVSVEGHSPSLKPVSSTAPYTSS